MLLRPQHLMLDQEEYLEKVKPLELTKERSREDLAFLSAEEATGFRSLLCSLLWVVQTRMDLAHDVVRLQTEMVCPQVQHAKELNNLRRRAKATAFHNGLHDRKVQFPLRVVGVGDAGHASKKSSYSYEGKMVLLMHDNMPGTDHEWLVGRDAAVLGGYAHCLWFSARRSQRVSHSTSHAETLAAVGTSQVAQLVAARITELFS